MPEPIAPSLFDFEFEKVDKVMYFASESGHHIHQEEKSGEGHYADLSLQEVVIICLVLIYSDCYSALCCIHCFRCKHICI